MTKGMLSHLNPKERIGYACLIGLLLFGFGYIGARHLRQPAPIVFNTAPPADSKPAQTAAQSIVAAPSSTVAVNTEVVVHVAGAVVRPGIVRLPEGSRVDDAVRAAGGATSRADLDAINLAAKLADGTQLRVPAKGEGQAPRMLPATSHRPVPTEIDKSGTITPVTIDPHYVALAENEKPAHQETSETTPTDSTASAKKSSGWAKKEVGDVNVNTATVDEMQSLPGVGPSTAQKIVDFRDQHGPFKSADDLLDVPGIGPKKLEKMRAYVKV